MPEIFCGLLADQSTITPDMARHVLCHFGEGGHRAGSFTMLLIELIARADVVNQAKLYTAYPGYVTATVLAQSHEDGIARLRAIIKAGEGRD